MLNNTGFDLWADHYDRSVGISDDDGTYPFAGYRLILGEIYRRVLTSAGRSILDIGFGTGTLTTRLYEQGCQVYGQDFSERMITLAQQKMPGAQLYQGDFSQGLAMPLTEQRYDAIIATYSLHHLTDRQKVDFLHSILPLLNEGGCIYIGDVAFETRSQMDQCRNANITDWDDDEIYFVYDELKQHFPCLTFEPMSPCAGLLTLKK